MDKLCLALAFTAIGMNFTLLKLGELFHYKSPLLFAVIMCLPAVLLGSLNWWAVRSFARSWQAVICVLIAWVGMLYAFEIEKNRGILAASLLTMTLPMAALIVKHRCWWFCAKVFVFANVFAMGLILWFQYYVHGIRMLYQVYRFGVLTSVDGTVQLVNPNVVGAQLTFAAILAFILYLRGGTWEDPLQDKAERPGRFSLGWTVFLSLGCILTASRGAFVAWLGSMTVLVFWGTRSQRPSKLRDFVAVSSVLVCAMLFFTVATGFKPWQTLQNRFDRGTQILLASGRTIIWKHAFDTWRSNTQYFLIGTGTGVAPEALGEFIGLTEPDNPSVVLGIDAHNAFVEWGLSFGVLGMAAGICLVVAACRKARRLDCRDGTINRQAILVCFGLISMTLVTFYQLSVVASGALILAMLSEPRPETPATPPADSQDVESPVPTMHGRLRTKPQATFSHQPAAWSDS